jgi:two-component sensor histidine kinase
MHDRVSVVIESDDIRLDSDDLMTLSLALNELLTNSLKHGFREGGTGTIGISVRAADGGMEVRYAESGAEQAGGRPFMERASFGMELVRGLAVQLNGELVQLDGKGTTLCLRTAPDSLLRSKAS